MEVGNTYDRSLGIQTGISSLLFRVSPPVDADQTYLKVKGGAKEETP